MEIYKTLIIMSCRHVLTFLDECGDEIFLICILKEISTSISRKEEQEHSNTPSTKTHLTSAQFSTITVDISSLTSMSSLQILSNYFFSRLVKYILFFTIFREAIYGTVYIRFLFNYFIATKQNWYYYWHSCGIYFPSYNIR